MISPILASLLVACSPVVRSDEVMMMQVKAFVDVAAEASLDAGVGANASLDVDLDVYASRQQATALADIQARVAGLKVSTKDSNALWMSDELTSLGSNLPVKQRKKGQKRVAGEFDGDENNSTELPVSTFFLGADGCAGGDVLGKVLSKHPGSIVGKSLEKNYFTSKTKGHCNRFAARDEEMSEYSRYLRSCFMGKVPSINRTTLDFSSSYAEHGFTALVPRMKEMAEEANLRFLALICEPRQRAVMAVQEELQGMKEVNPTDNTTSPVTADEMSNSISHGLRKHRAGSYSHNIGAGEYSRIITAWAQHFPLESILVVNPEHLDDVRTWKRIFNHIGLKNPNTLQLWRWIDEAKPEEDADVPVESEVPVRSPDELEHFVQKRLDEHYRYYDTSLWSMIDTEYW